MPAHARAPPPLATAAVPCLGLGLSLSLSLGSGFLPGLVLFESGPTGMGCEHTRSVIRTGPPTDQLRYPDPNRPANGLAPLTGSKPPRQWLSVNRRGSWAVGRLLRLKRTVATVGWVRTLLPLPECYK